LVVFLVPFCSFLSRKATDIGCFSRALLFLSAREKQSVFGLSHTTTDNGCFLEPTASASERQSNSLLASPEGSGEPLSVQKSNR
jgi:hypothetical protein